MNLATLFALLWAGLIIGISFVATPAKFLAASLDLARALEVGQATFGVLRWIDFAALLTLGLLSGRLDHSNTSLILFCSLTTLLMIQYVGLFPGLETRTSQIIAGVEVKKSHLHSIYIIVELGKVACLISYAVIINSLNRIPSS